jgi:hypothetical protein
LQDNTASCLVAIWGRIIGLASIPFHDPRPAFRCEPMRSVPIPSEPLRLAARALPLDAIGEDSIAHMYRLWTARRGSRPMPAPGDLLPEEFGAALGKVNLLDVLRAPLRFVYRVRGSQIAGIIDQRMVGSSVAEMQPPEYRDMLLRHYGAAAATGRPSLYHIRQSRHGVTSEYHRLILPLGSAAGLVERLLTVSAWGPDFAHKALLLGFKRR